MASANDFSVITGLLDTKKLYDEQEEKWKLRLSEAEDAAAAIRKELGEVRSQMDARIRASAELEAEISRLRADNDRVQKDAAQKIGALNDRIKQLNAQLAEFASGKRPAANEGFFKR